MAKPVKLRILGLILIFTNDRMTASYAYQQTSPIFRVIIVSNQEFIRPGISGSGAIRTSRPPRRIFMTAPARPATSRKFPREAYLSGNPACTQPGDGPPGYRNVPKWDDSSSAAKGPVVSYKSFRTSRFHQCLLYFMRTAAEVCESDLPLRTRFLIR